MKKQFFSVLLVVCMLVCLIPATNVFADGEMCVLDRIMFKGVISEKIEDENVTALRISTDKIPSDAKTSKLNKDGSVKCYIKSEHDVKTAIVATANPKDIVSFPEDSSEFFEGLPLESVILNGADTSDVRNMSAMFCCCKKLKLLDLCSFNTSKVNSMRNMFEYCTELQALELTSFNTSNVTDMDYMFDNCIKLQELIIDTFDISNVRRMIGMFYNCKKLEHMNLNCFRNNDHPNMLYMFVNCPIDRNYVCRVFGISNYDKQQRLLSNTKFMFENTATSD